MENKWWREILRKFNSPSGHVSACQGMRVTCMMDVAVAAKHSLTRAPYLRRGAWWGYILLNSTSR